MWVQSKTYIVCTHNLCFEKNILQLKVSIFRYEYFFCFCFFFFLGTSQDSLILLTGSTGKIRPPDRNADGIYDNNVDIMWLIEADTTKVIRCQISYVDIEYTQGCTADALVVCHYGNLPIQSTAIFFFNRKLENFIGFFYIFLIFAQNIDCGYTLELPRRGGSNEYPQSMFLSKNKKNRYTPASRDPSFAI